jgi:hypothetical protein
MRLLPQRRVPVRPPQARPGPDADGPDPDPDPDTEPGWLMQPAGIVSAGTAVAAAVLIGTIPALILGGGAHGSGPCPPARPAACASPPAPTAPGPSATTGPSDRDRHRWLAPVPVPPHGRPSPRPVTGR